MEHLLPISRSKICDLSSAQTGRHSVTNWWRVALTGVMAGSTAKWSKQFNKWGTHKETNLRYPHLNSILPSSKACSSITRGFQLQLGLVLDPTMAQDDVWWRPLFAFSCVSLRPLLTHRQPRENMDHHSLHLEKRVHSGWSWICRNTVHSCYKLDGISMGAPVEAPVASS